MNLLTLFSNNLLPILITAGSGFLLGKWFDLKPDTLSRVVFYLFSPCLVFQLLTSSQLATSDIFRMAGFTAANLFIIGFLTWLVGLALHIERRLLIAMILVSTFGNSGNFGLSLNLFAFGDNALAHASLFFVTSAILIYSIGVLIASLGHANLRQSLSGLLKVPVVYGLALGMLSNSMQWQIPLPLERTVNLLAQAAIPAMLVMLGLQLKNIHWSGWGKSLGAANILRLAVSPLLGIALATFFHMQGAAYQAGIVETAMPTAVMTTVLATEYDVEPGFVTAVVFTTTLLSPLTLTPLLAILGG